MEGPFRPYRPPGPSGSLAPEAPDAAAQTSRNFTAAPPAPPADASSHPIPSSRSTTAALAGSSAANSPTAKLPSRPGVYTGHNPDDDDSDDDRPLAQLREDLLRTQRLQNMKQTQQQQKQQHQGRNLLRQHNNDLNPMQMNRKRGHTFDHRRIVKDYGVLESASEFISMPRAPVVVGQAQQRRTQEGSTLTSTSALKLSRPVLQRSLTSDIYGTVVSSLHFGGGSGVQGHQERVYYVSSRSHSRRNSLSNQQQTTLQTLTVPDQLPATAPINFSTPSSLRSGSRPRSHSLSHPEGFVSAVTAQFAGGRSAAVAASEGGGPFSMQSASQSTLLPPQGLGAIDVALRDIGDRYSSLGSVGCDGSGGGQLQIQGSPLLAGSGGRQQEEANNGARRRKTIDGDNNISNINDINNSNNNHHNQYNSGSKSRRNSLRETTAVDFDFDPDLFYSTTSSATAAATVSNNPNNNINPSTFSSSDAATAKEAEAKEKEKEKEKEKQQQQQQQEADSVSLYLSNYSLQQKQQYLGPPTFSFSSAVSPLTKAQTTTTTSNTTTKNSPTVTITTTTTTTTTAKTRTNLIKNTPTNTFRSTRNSIDLSRLPHTFESLASAAPLTSLASLAPVASLPASVAAADLSVEAFAVFSPTLQTHANAPFFSDFSRAASSSSGSLLSLSSSATLGVSPFLPLEIHHHQMPEITASSPSALPDDTSPRTPTANRHTTETLETEDTDIEDEAVSQYYDADTSPYGIITADTDEYIYQDAESMSAPLPRIRDAAAADSDIPDPIGAPGRSIPGNSSSDTSFGTAAISCSGTRLASVPHHQHDSNNKHLLTISNSSSTTTTIGTTIGAGSWPVVGPGHISVKDLKKKFDQKCPTGGSVSTGSPVAAVVATSSSSSSSSSPSAASSVSGATARVTARIPRRSAIPVRRSRDSSPSLSVSSVDTLKSRRIQQPTMITSNNNSGSSSSQQSFANRIRKPHPGINAGADARADGPSSILSAAVKGDASAASAGSSLDSMSITKANSNPVFASSFASAAYAGKSGDRLDEIAVAAATHLNHYQHRYHYHPVQPLLFGEISREPTTTASVVPAAVGPGFRIDDNNHHDRRYPHSTITTTTAVPVAAHHRGISESGLFINTSALSSLSSSLHLDSNGPVSSAVVINKHHNSGKPALPTDWYRSAESQQPGGQSAVDPQNPHPATKKTVASAAMGQATTPRSRHRSSSDSPRIASSRSRMAAVSSRLLQPQSITTTKTTKTTKTATSSAAAAAAATSVSPSTITTTTKTTITTHTPTSQSYIPRPVRQTIVSGAAATGHSNSNSNYNSPSSSRPSSPLSIDSPTPHPAGAADRDTSRRPRPRNSRDCDTTRSGGRENSKRRPLPLQTNTKTSTTTTEAVNATDTNNNNNNYNSAEADYADSTITTDGAGIPATTESSLDSSSISGQNSSAAAAMRLRDRSPFGARMKAAVAAATSHSYSSSSNSSSNSHTDSSAARLPAVATTQSPLLSPQLRSSRPRQQLTGDSSHNAAGFKLRSTDAHAYASNTTTTTNSNRLRVATATGASLGPGAAERDKDADFKQRRISEGPIDFEQRRNDIRLKYIKTIREKQERAAARRRTRELASVSAAAEAKSVISVAKAKSCSARNSFSGLISGEVHNSPGALETLAAQVLSHATALAASDDIPVSPRAVPPELVVASPESSSIAATMTAASMMRTDPVPDGQRSSSDATTDAASQQQSPPSPAISEQFIIVNNNLTSNHHSVPARDSPMLGLPNGFPPENLQDRDNSNDEPVFAASIVHTKFDVDEPVDLVSPRSLGPFSGVEPSVAGSFKTPPRSPNLTATTGHLHINYRYPFGEDEDIPSGELSPTLPLSPVQPRKPSDRMLTDYSSAIHEDEEYTLPAQTSSTGFAHSTIVRIFRRESDIIGPNQAPQVHPLRDYDYEDSIYRFMPGSATATAIRHIRHDDDSCEEESVLPVSDIPLAIRTASVPYIADNEEISGTPTEDTVKNTSSNSVLTHGGHNLSVPLMLVPGNRLSMLSAWTDFSIDSRDSAKQSLDYPDISSLTINTRLVPTSHIDMPKPSPLDAELPPLPAEAHDLVSPQESTYSVKMTTPTADSRSQQQFQDHNLPPAPLAKTDSTYDRDTLASSLYEQSYSGITLGSRPVSRDRTTVATSIARSSVDKIRFVESASDADVPPAVPPKNDVDDKERRRLVQRRNVVKELVDTEAAFVRDMSVVWEIYKGTAEACPKLDPKTIKLIFRNTDEIIAYHMAFTEKLKQAVETIYVPVVRSAVEEASKTPEFNTTDIFPPPEALDDTKDFKTTLGSLFKESIEEMKTVHEVFLRASDLAARRLIEIQQDPAVKVWLNECHEISKDLTAAWDLDSLLIKPMQRITKYPNLIMSLLEKTPQEHPDRAALIAAKEMLEDAIIEINKTKKNFELVGQIVSGKRKDSDVKAGIARAFGKRADKMQPGSRMPEDEVYRQLDEKFNEDFIRLQVVLRDAEDYTIQVSSYVHEFLQYLSSIELVMRLQPSGYPELESKWVQFNVSMRDMEKVVLERFLTQIRKMVIMPIEDVIKSYRNPELAMKKRQKRRLNYEKAELLKKSGKAVDTKLAELVEQYEALNDTLKKELPILSVLTAKVGKICMGNLVNIQTSWYQLWRDRVRAVLPDNQDTYEIGEIVAAFKNDFAFIQQPISELGILNPVYMGKTSLSTLSSMDDVTARARIRPLDLSPRSRGLSINSEAPVLPTPDFARRSSGSLTSPLGSGIETIPTLPSMQSPTFNYDSYYTSASATSHSQASSVSHLMMAPATQTYSHLSSQHHYGRPSTGISLDSGTMTRQSSEMAYYQRRDSMSTYVPNYPATEASGGGSGGKRFSGMFHSALPANERGSLEEREREGPAAVGPEARGYHVLWLAASLFEFNIATTKQEAGYPYLVYQAGEVFDVLGEKGELWLARNQDDEGGQVGWIWSKHFAKLAGN